MEKPTSYENEDNLKATELRLGLPGSHDENNNHNPAPAVVKGNKRAQPEIHINNSHQECSPPTKTQVVGWPPVRSYRKNVLQPKKNEADLAGTYVKVSMDGAPYLRKIDLKIYKGYQELLIGLQNMFKCTIGHNNNNNNNGGEYVTTYEDKDGDWMLAGDVPWDMFVSTCKRIRIMKASEAKGLGCL